MANVDQIREGLTRKLSEYLQLNFNIFASTMEKHGVISLAQLNEIQRKRFPGTNEQKMFELFYLIYTTEQSQGTLSTALEEALGVNKLNRMDLLNSSAASQIPNESQITEEPVLSEAANRDPISGESNSMHRREGMAALEDMVSSLTSQLAEANERILNLETELHAEKNKFKADIERQTVNNEMVVLESEKQFQESERARLTEIYNLKDALAAQNFGNRKNLHRR